MIRREKIILMAAFVISVAFVAWLLFSGTSISSDTKSRVQTFGSVVGFVLAVGLLAVAVSQLNRTAKHQRATFLKDYMTELLNDGELYETYQDLVYNYPNAKFFQNNEDFKKQYYDNLPGTKSLDMDENLNWSFFETPYYRDEIEVIAIIAEAGVNFTKPNFLPSFQMDGKTSVAEGKRLYHPAIFQGSREEARLDRLLQYIDVIAYYYNSHIIEKDEIHGSIGSIIMTLCERRVIKYYLDILREGTHLRSKKQDRLTMAPIPFENLAKFLDSLR